MIDKGENLWESAVRNLSRKVLKRISHPKTELVWEIRKRVSFQARADKVVNEYEVTTCAEVENLSQHAFSPLLRCIGEGGSVISYQRLLVFLGRAPICRPTVR